MINVFSKLSVSTKKLNIKLFSCQQEVSELRQRKCPMMVSGPKNMEDWQV